MEHYSENTGATYGVVTGLACRRGGCLVLWHPRVGDNPVHGRYFAADRPLDSPQRLDLPTSDYQSAVVTTPEGFAAVGIRYPQTSMTFGQFKAGTLSFGPLIPLPANTRTVATPITDGIALTGYTPQAGYYVIHVDGTGKVVGSTDFEPNTPFPGDVVGMSVVQNHDLLLFSRDDDEAPNQKAKRLFVTFPSPARPELPPWRRIKQPNWND
jgi:hypothetical protein